MAHIPVLLHEVIAGLKPQGGETLLDATVGSGGHALALGELVGKEGRVIGLDQDEYSLAQAKVTLARLECRVDLVQANFRDLAQVLAKLEVEKLDLALFDLGVHSDQLGASGRGFSFLHDEPLLMIQNTAALPDKLSAGDIVNFWSAQDLENVLTAYGEEKFAPRIVKAILTARREAPIKTTFQLVEVIKSAVPRWYQKQKLHPATKTFQALRIAVNDELDALREGLAQAWSQLNSHGRLAVISFHSLEARIVKEYFKSLVKSGAGELVTKHALKPTWPEQKNNPRSRSAQLKIIRKI